MAKVDSLLQDNAALKEQLNTVLADNAALRKQLQAKAKRQRAAAATESALVPSGSEAEMGSAEEDSTTRRRSPGGASPAHAQN